MRVKRLVGLIMLGGQPTSKNFIHQKASEVYNSQNHPPDKKPKNILRVVPKKKATHPKISFQASKYTIEELRIKMNNNFQKMRDIYTKADEDYYQYGDWIEAKELSKKALKYKKKGEEYKRQLNEANYKKLNGDLDSSNEIDLHGQFKNSALEIVASKIKQIMQKSCFPCELKIITVYIIYIYIYA